MLIQVLVILLHLYYNELGMPISSISFDSLKTTVSEWEAKLGSCDVISSILPAQNGSSIDFSP